MARTPEHAGAAERAGAGERLGVGTRSGLLTHSALLTLVGGSLAVQSQPGTGTMVVLRVPRSEELAAEG